MKIKRVLLAVVTALAASLAALGSERVLATWPPASIGAAVRADGGVHTKPDERQLRIASGKGGITGDVHSGVNAPAIHIDGGRGGMSGDLGQG